MTVNEFIEYFKLGHGKAITLLRKEPDKKQFQQAFLENINETYLLEHSNLEYVERIMHILADDEFRLKMKSAFIDFLSYEHISYDHIGAYKLLDSLGYPNEAYQCLTTIYEESYKFTKNMLESRNYKNYNFRAGYLNYKCSCGYLGRYCENDIPKLLKDDADLYLIADDFDYFSPIYDIYCEFQKQDRGEYFKELFDAVLKDHKAYETLKASVFSVIKEWESKEYKTLEDFRNFNKVIYEFNDYADLKCSLLKASDELYREVAQMALDETDLNKKELLFELLKKETEEYGATRQFPLSPQPLIEMARKCLDNSSVKKDEASAVNYQALQILAEMKNPVAKEFCLRVFNNSKADIHIRNEVIHTLEENYTPDDEKLIRGIYPEFNLNVITILYELSEKGIKDAPYDLLFDAYENTEYWYKYLTVQALINTGLITDEMLNECEFDAFFKVADAAKKEIVKRSIK